MTNRYKSTQRGYNNRQSSIRPTVAPTLPPSPKGYRTCSNCITFYKNCKLLQLPGATEESMKNCCAWFKPIKEKK